MAGSITTSGAKVSQGRCYVSEGKSHLINFTASAVPQPNERSSVTTVAVGERGSELKLARPGTVELKVKVSALLDETPSSTRSRFSWNIESARIGQSREVPVEVVVNGYPVTSQNITAEDRKSVV